jgi:parallel beta-helix repeat protein
VSVRKSALVYQQAGCAGSKVRGVGFRHYSTEYGQVGAVRVAATSDITFENCHFDGASFSGAFVQTSTGVRIVRNTFRRCGQLGLRGYKAPELTVEANVFEENNTGHFSGGGAAGGMKVDTNCDHARIRWNLVRDNVGAGLWVDVYSSNATIVGNVVERNTACGIFFEYSDGAVIAGNITRDNNGIGIQMGEAANVEVWNNTLIDDGISFYEGRRAAIAAGCRVRNNVITIRSGAAVPFSTRDYNPTGIKPWDGLGWTQDSNAVYRRSSTTASIFASHQSATVARTVYANRGALRIIGQELNGLASDNTAVDPFLYVDDTPKAALACAGEPLPANVAAALGLPAGEAPTIGAIQWRTP